MVLLGILRVSVQAIRVCLVRVFLIGNRMVVSFAFFEWLSVYKWDFEKKVCLI